MLSDAQVQWIAQAMGIAPEGKTPEELRAKVMAWPLRDCSDRLPRVHYRRRVQVTNGG